MTTPSPTHLAIILTAIILLAIIRMPHLTAAAAHNTAARQTAIHCAQPTAAQASLTTSLWLQAINAHCLGHHHAARAAFTAIIQQSSARLPAIRAAYPHDIPLAQQAAGAHPANPAAHFWLAEAHRAAANPTAAIAAYQHGLQLAPYQGANWLWLGRLQQEQGQTDHALAAYLNACSYQDPGKHGCRDAAAIYYDRADYSAAAQYYERSIQQIPTHAPTRRRLAESYLALGDHTAAQPHLEWLADRGDSWAIEERGAQ